MGLFHQTMRRLLFKICQWWKLFLVVKKPAQCILNVNIYKKCTFILRSIDPVYEFSYKIIQEQGMLINDGQG